MDTLCQCEGLWHPYDKRSRCYPILRECYKCLEQVCDVHVVTKTWIMSTSPPIQMRYSKTFYLCYRCIALEKDKENYDCRQCLNGNFLAENADDLCILGIIYCIKKHYPLTKGIK
mgnify:CR=1 FL=1